MSYQPQLNDFVRWKNDIEGWVYFKGNDYLTLEVSVRPKDKQNYQHCSLHRNERLLVICYYYQWGELEYIKSRKSIYEEDECMENNCQVTG
jgi:hypothetical protein